MQHGAPRMMRRVNAKDLFFQTGQEEWENGMFWDVGGISGEPEGWMCCLW